ncbi:MAG: hypothetical protein HOH58_15610 [Opitutaceae bacterium]|jgi:hypothetical protein|nr:hypothetical protein [Opitutaceae bacterium]
MAKTQKKLDRELYGPSLFEVTFGALLSIALGGILATGYLIAQPVESVRALPREPDPDKVYYVKGSARSSLGGQWLRKKQLLTEEGSIQLELNEDELNTWHSSSKAKSDSEETPGIISAQEINFRISDDALQVGVPCDFSVPGFAKSFVVQARGEFLSDGDRFNFEPKEVMIGQLAAHKLPLVGTFIMNRIFSAQEIPHDMEDAWDSLDEVKVQGDKILLVRR